MQLAGGSTTVHLIKTSKRSEQQTTKNAARKPRLFVHLTALRALPTLIE
ncbi:hypothetical protein CES85_1142 [Ochrobactrum quorumnocens]|uniref:Uncharacterized protein n=1 Tax=Ochrobactrum quorumnocens TaxID=271865 RepID=A0A248UGJ5_9HYPH|nr:hypothetical protein CES85_1142 [[Ochrobactrum] quorumnocens]